MKKHILVIGLGEIGNPLLKIISGAGYSVSSYDLKKKSFVKKQRTVDVLHICFPYSNKFVDEVCNYISEYKPKLTLIESTVKPFTTQKIYENFSRSIRICHSPVRGNVKDTFEWAFFAYTKFIGPADKDSGEQAEQYYKSLGFKTYICKSPLETEFMKIINTTYYGLLIAWFQEINRICETFNIDYEEIRKFIETTTTESGNKHVRPIMIPGFIGGHCVIPNANLLNECFSSEFITAIINSNKKRKAETLKESN